VKYHSLGFECGHGDSPVNYAEVATYHLSVPWRLTDQKGISAVVHATVPPCGSPSGSDGAMSGLAAIDITMYMSPRPCHPYDRRHQAQVAYDVDILSPLIHAPTGLILSRATSRFRLLYFDGKDRSIFLGCYANPGGGGNPPLKC